MSRHCNNFLDFAIEEEVDPKNKFNSLISATVSTVMCIAARCPLPKSNIETTKLFLRTITDENGQTPRNIKGFLTLLNSYSGPYESDPPYEKPIITEKQITNEEICLPGGESDGLAKSSRTQLVTREETSVMESQVMLKRSGKTGLKRSEKESKKAKEKSLVSKIDPRASKSLLTKF